MADTSLSSAYTSEISNRIAEFESQYYTISRSLNMYGRYNTWVHFECNTLVVDSINPVNKNIILQTWEYNKNGSGKANSFTLRICYDFANSAELYKNDDIHYVEKALCINTIMENSEGFISGYKSNIDKLKCKFRYGYVNVGTNSAQVLSPNYEGMVTSCVPELRDNMLFYTIKGVSGTFGGHDSRTFSFPAVKNKKATEVAKTILENYYGEGYKNPGNKENQNGFMYALTEPYEIINRAEAYSDKEGTIELSSTNNTVFGYVNNVLSSANFSNYLKEEEMKKIEKDKRPHYTFYVDDIPNSAGKKRIVIDLIDPCNIIKRAYSVRKAEGAEGWEDVEIPTVSSDDYDTSVVFTYPNKSQNFILSFIPSVDLNVMWAGVVVDSDKAERWGIDDGGILLKTESLDDTGFISVTRSSNTEENSDGSEDNKSNTEGGTTSGKPVANNGESQIQIDAAGTDASAADKADESSLIQTVEGTETISSFAKASDISYKATMSCIGLPCDIPIGTRIKIQPILNGVPYMFSGSYYIISCSDRIDSSGYITDMQLFRLGSRSDNIFDTKSTKADSQTKETNSTTNTGGGSSTHSGSSGISHGGGGGSF